VWSLASISHYLYLRLFDRPTIWQVRVLTSISHYFYSQVFARHTIWQVRVLAGTGHHHLYLWLFDRPTICDCLIALPFVIIWSPYHLWLFDRPAICEYLIALPFVIIWSPCYLWLFDRPTICDYLIALPFVIIWSPCHLVGVGLNRTIQLMYSYQRFDMSLTALLPQCGIDYASPEVKKMKGCPKAGCRPVSSATGDSRYLLLWTYPMIYC
jgi:hypothetical protein